MGVWIFVFGIIFLPIIVGMVIFGIPYVYDPLLRIGFIVSIAGGYLWFSLVKKRYTQRHNGYFEDVTSVDGIVEGVNYQYKITRDDKNKINFISVAVEDIYGYDFALNFETVFERFFKFFGLSRECQSGDKLFDETIYIVSDDQWLCEQLQIHKELREKLYSIFWLNHSKEIDIKKIQCFDGRMIVTSKPLVENISDNDAKEFCKSTALLIKNSMTFFPSKATASDLLYRERTSKIAFVFKLVVMVLLINGGLILFLESRNYVVFPQLVEANTIIALALISTAIFLGVAAISILIGLRKSSRLSLVFIQMFTLGALGVFLSALVEIKEIDVYLDDSKAQTFESVLLEKEIRSGRKRSTTYHFFVRSWLKSGYQHEIEVDASLYNQVNPSDHILIIQREGFLNYPWIEKLILAPKN